VPVGCLEVRDTVLATVEVVSCSAAAVSAELRPAPGVRCSSYRRRDTVLAGTYQHHCLYVLAKAVQGSDRSIIRSSQGRILDRSTGHDWAPLTGDKI